MRILIVSTFFPPLESIASLRPVSWAKYWSAMGHDVHILTTKKGEHQRSVSLLNTEVAYKVHEVPHPDFISKMNSKFQKNTGGNASVSNSPSMKGRLKSLLQSIREKKVCFTLAVCLIFQTFGFDLPLNMHKS